MRTLLFLLLSGVLATPAMAQPTMTSRNYLMEMNFRGRYMKIPDSILDIWFFDEDDSTGHLPRPDIEGYTLGLEYGFRKDTANWILYFEYGGSLMEEGYWDDVDDDGTTTDGSYVVPDHLGMVNFGGNYAYALKAEDWLSFLFGGGLGVTMLTGQVIEWKPGNVTDAATELNDPDCTMGDGSLSDPHNAPAYERYGAGCGDDGAVTLPKVLPIVDINLGVRFDIKQRASIRLEGGFHDMLYFGGATGIVF